MKKCLCVCLLCCLLCLWGCVPQTDTPFVDPLRPTPTPAVTAEPEPGADMPDERESGADTSDEPEPGADVPNEQQSGADAPNEQQPGAGASDERESGADTPDEQQSGADRPADSAQADPAFADLAPTVHMSFAELVGDNGVYEEPDQWPEAGTYRLVVDVTHQVVLAYAADETGAYTVPVRYMICSTGAKGTSSPIGTFHMGEHRVRFGKFVHDNVFGQYWSNITGRIYFHSLLYTKQDASTYTKTSYNKLGSRASHGCIRLLAPDARWIWYHAGPGTEVEIRQGSRDDEETAAIRAQLTRPPLPAQRPSLTPGGVPDTDNWQISDLIPTNEASQ